MALARSYFMGYNIVEEYLKKLKILYVHKTTFSCFINLLFIERSSSLSQRTIQSGLSIKKISLPAVLAVYF